MKEALTRPALDIDRSRFMQARFVLPLCCITRTHNLNIGFAAAAVGLAGVGRLTHGSGLDLPDEEDDREQKDKVKDDGTEDGPNVLDRTG